MNAAEAMAERLRRDWMERMRPAFARSPAEKTARAKAAAKALGQAVAAMGKAAPNVM